jgi:type I restriction enzyme R subunit
LELKEDSVPYKTANEAADMAVQIDEAIQKRLRVDWRMNPDVQNEMRNAIDDLLYETRAKKGLPLSVQDMDTIIERALEIAKNRYPR